jgi:hypothetical protein
MLRLFGANSGVAVVVGIGLLIIGIATGRYLLAAAGGFVVLGSAVRLLSPRRDQSAGNERVQADDDRHGPAGWR